MTTDYQAAQYRYTQSVLNQLREHLDNIDPEDVAEYIDFLLDDLDTRIHVCEAQKIVDTPPSRGYDSLGTLRGLYILAIGLGIGGLVIAALK